MGGGSGSNDGEGDGVKTKEEAVTPTTTPAPAPVTNNETAGIETSGEKKAEGPCGLPAKCVIL